MDEYERLLAAAKLDPTNADFLALRLAYTRSPQFDPYLKTLHTPTALRAALQQDSEAQIGAGIQRVLQDDYLDIETHIVAHNFYRQSGKGAKADYHGAFARGLLRSIMTTDGRSTISAFRVLSIREEYAVMAALGLRVKMQRKTVESGRNYDILTAEHPQTGEDIDFYFNIDLMRSYFKAPITHNQDQPLS